MPSFELLAVFALVLLAVGNLTVGVVNDATNFLNSAIGSKVSSRRIIMLVSVIGIIIGATFSDGIIEVARKGIFRPEFFSANEALMIFTAVAMTDILLLDFYSTFGLPTSTTVSLVFELFGAALALAILKTGGIATAWSAINSESAMKIITGIILSVVFAFIIGLFTQFFTRLFFTFNYEERMRKWGFLWSGLALTCLFSFIILIGGKHASFMTSSLQNFISVNLNTILFSLFVAFSLFSLILIKLRVNILKIIVLIGTGALALAFAGNDLANFIGVSVGGVHAYINSNLTGSLPTPTWVLLGAGMIMSVAMMISKKARTVNNTAVSLASHNEKTLKKWDANLFMHRLAMIIVFLSTLPMKIMPTILRKKIAARINKFDKGKGADYDLLRAGVNLMVSAALISWATAQKLPLSTTYVTFIVAMATALADGAWTKDCAPTRVAGVLMVISGWFMTAILAIVATGITISVLFFLRTAGLLLMSGFIVLVIFSLTKIHFKREEN